MFPNREEWLTRMQTLLKQRNAFTSMWSSQTSGIVDSRKLGTNISPLEDSTSYRQYDLKGNIVSTINDLILGAEQAKPVFNETIKSMAKNSKFTLHFSDNVGWEWWNNRAAEDEYSSCIIFMPIKNKEEILKKASSAYKYNDTPLSWVCDVIRASFVCTSEMQIIYVIDMIKACHNFEIFKIKNRFTSPAPSGYRDILVHSLFKYELNGKPYKFLCEIQIHHIEVLSYSKKMGTYATYKYFREFFNLPYNQNSIASTDSLMNIRLLIFKRMEQIISNPSELEVMMESYFQSPTRSTKDFDRLEAFAILFKNTSEHLLREKCIRVIIELLKDNKNSSGILKTEIDLAKYIWELAINLKSQYRFEEAIECITESNSIFKAHLGQAHIFHTTGLIITGRMLCAEERFSEALPYFQSAHDIRLAAFGLSHPDTIISLECLADVLFELKEWEESRNTYETLLECLIQRENMSLEIAQVMTNIAEIMEHQNCLEESVALYQSVIDIRSTLLGPESHLVADSLCSQAEVLDVLGRFNESLSLFQNALEIKRQIFGENHIHSDIADILGSIAGVLDELDRSEEAIPYYEQALKLRIEIFGDDSLPVSEVYNDMAESLLYLGEANRAGEYFEKAQHIREDQLGEDNPATKQTVGGLASVHEHESYRYIPGRVHGVSNNNSSSSPLRGSLVGSSTTGTRSSIFVRRGKRKSVLDPFMVHEKAKELSSTATELREAGDFEQAERVLTTALNMLKELYYDSHPAIATIQNNIAVLKEDLGEYAEALELYKLSLDKFLRSYGDDHLIVITVRSNYALALRNQGKFQDALDEFQTVLDSRLQRCIQSSDDFRSIFGNDGISTSGEFDNNQEGQAQDGILQRNFNGTFDNISTVGSIPRLNSDDSEEDIVEVDVNKITDPYVASAMHNIGQCYRRLGKFTEARESYEMSLTLRLRLQGDDHPDYAATLNSLGILLLEEMKYEEGLQELEKSVKARQDIYERNHPFVALALNNLGVTYQLLTDNATAGAVYDEALKIREKWLGHNAPEVGNMLLNISSLFHSQGDDVESYNMFHRAKKYPTYSLEIFHPLIS